MSNKLVVPLLCAAALVFACGPRPHTPDQPAEPGSGAPVTRQPNTPGQPLATGLDITVGEQVSLRFHVTNTTAKQLEISFGSGQTHDFTVLDASGTELWRWSADRMFTQALQTRLLGAGETITYTEIWRPSSGTRGALSAVAKLVSSSHPLESRAEFRLP